MRIQRVSDIPHGELARLLKRPGCESVLLLNARLLTEAQASQLGRQIADRLRGTDEFGV